MYIDIDTGRKTGRKIKGEMKIMVTAEELAKEFTFIDLEPWIEEIENRINNVKYPSKADVELLPKIKAALEIVNSLDTFSL